MAEKLMKMVFGEYEYNLDSKGRLVIPPKFREFLGDEFVLTKGLDHCIFVFPMEEWQEFQSKLATLPISEKSARSFTRFFFASAAESRIDRQGRASIPASLRSFAGLQKNTVIVGVASRVEIWDKDKWDEYNASTEDFAEKMAELGI